MFVKLICQMNQKAIGYYQGVTKSLFFEGLKYSGQTKTKESFDDIQQCKLKKQKSKKQNQTHPTIIMNHRLLKN